MSTESSLSAELLSLQKQGEELDAELIRTLSRRLELAHRIRAAAEAARPGATDRDDAAWLQRLLEETPTPEARAMRPILRELRAATRSIEDFARVAYLGPAGGHCHQMVRRHFGENAELNECANVADTLAAVTRGRAAFAVFPLESSAEGIAQSSVVALAESELYIVGERTMPTGFDLLSSSNIALDRIDTVFVSGPALTACELFLRQRLPNARAVETVSPSDALEHARQAEYAAAIVPAGALLALSNGAESPLSTLESNIGDVPDAFSRFAVAARRPARRAEHNTTCLMFGVQDRPGALFEVLRHFAERGLNLGKVQSRPLAQGALLSGPGWDYAFYVEVEGHETDRAMVTALDHVKRSAKFLRVLGSYPVEPLD